MTSPNVELTIKNPESLPTVVVENESIQITKKTPLNKLYHKYKTYFNKHSSFYKTYNPSIYTQLKNLETNMNEFETLLKSDLFVKTEKYLIPYLKKSNFTNFGSSKNITQLERIISSVELPGYVEPGDHLILDLAVALNIEKYYLECKSYFNECPEYPKEFQGPIFDPCKYPHLVGIYDHFFAFCYDQRQLHSETSKHYIFQNKCFLVPSLLFAGIGSSFSFLGATSFFSEYVNRVMSLIVGLATCMVVLLQSFISAYGFDVRASHHNQAADMYDQVLTTIDLEKSYPSNNTFFKDLERELSKIKSNCPYLVPTSIKKIYYRNKDKKGYNSFIKKMIIEPGRREIIDSIISGNTNMNINENIDFIQNRIMEINKLENTLTDLNINIKRKIDKDKLERYPLPLFKKLM